MTDLERIQAAALSLKITLEQYARQVLQDPGGYSKRTVAAVREWQGEAIEETEAQTSDEWAQGALERLRQDREDLQLDLDQISTRQPARAYSRARRSSAFGDQ